MKRFFRTLWHDIWGGDPPTSIGNWIVRMLTPPKDCTRCHGIGEEPGDMIDCTRCRGCGLEPR